MGWVGVGLSVIGTIREGQQRKRALEREAEFLGYEQRFDEAVADLEIGNLQRRYQRILGRANMANAVSGFDPSSRSSMRAVKDILRQAEMDKMSIMLSSRIKKFKAESEIQSYGTAARNVETASYFKAGEKLVQGFGRYYGR